MKYVFYAHRKRFIPYFTKVSKNLEHSYVYTFPRLLRFFFSKPKLIDGKKQKEITSYYVSIFDYKNKKSWLEIFLYRIFFSIKLVFVYSVIFNFYKYYKDSFIVVWGESGLVQKILQSISRAQAINNLIYMENGFLPNTTAIDRRGLNAQCSLPRSVEFYKSLIFDDFENLLPKSLVIRDAKKGIVQKKIDLSSYGDYFFIPFQCNRDSVIKSYSPFIKNMWELFDLIVEVASQNTSINFIIKEHPSCPEDYHALYEKIDSSKINNIFFMNQVNTESLIKQSTGVITINSSVGFESLLFSKPVICLGDAAYSLSGLVQSSMSLQELKDSIIKIVNGTWVLDDDLNEKFLRFVYYRYLVKGTRKNMSDDHIQSVASKLIGLTFEDKFQ